MGPDAYVICGEAACERWARSLGQSFVTGGVVRQRKAGPTFPRCDHCGRPLPRDREPFRDGDLAFCTLTCQQRWPPPSNT